MSIKDEEGDPVVYWLCKECYTKAVDLNPSKKVTTNEICFVLTNPTTNGSRHMEGVHNYRKDGTRRTEPPKKRTITEAFDAIDAANNRTFDRAHWQSSYTKWITRSGISLRDATSDGLRAFITAGSPHLEPLLPQSHVTARGWVVDNYRNAKPQMTEDIAQATSCLTISFDAWTANKDVLDLLGVVVHYLSSDYQLRTVLLALRDTMASHTGANMNDILQEVLSEYQITKVAYFAADNAPNNDTAIGFLAKEPAWKEVIKPKAARLRCAGHIYNLVCQAMLFGVDEDAIADFEDPSDSQATSDTSTTSTQAVNDFEVTFKYGDEEAWLQAWRKKGPVGKLHNIITDIKAYGARRRLFNTKQQEVIDITVDETSHTKVRLVDFGGCTVFTDLW